MNWERVQGFCPMGCGEMLFITRDDGHVTCGGFGCPDPRAVTKLLADNECEHLVTLSEEDETGAFCFTIRHPLRERLRDELMQCGLHYYLASFEGPVRALGQYRVTLTPCGWVFELKE